MTENQSYPLRWPVGWPRHKGTRDWDGRFRGPTYRWDRVFSGIHHELKRIGATEIIVSTNQPLRADGAPYAQQHNIDDPGVAVYFHRNGKPLAMAQDRFDTVIGNMRSLTMAIEGLRQMERHGGAVMLERAFEGFAALPPPDSCWKILGLDKQVVEAMQKDRLRNASLPGLIADSFRARAREPQNNGDMDRLVKARDAALKEVS